MASYTFKEECDVCEQRPILKDTGMCATCTFGERGAMWEWLDDFPKSERKLAEEYVLEMLDETNAIDEKGNFDPIVAMLLHIDQDVIDKIEERVM